MIRVCALAKADEVTRNRKKNNCRAHLFDMFAHNELYKAY